MTQSMYQDYFGISENPFSIIPDPHYLYMSQRHQEALAHLLYGVSDSGGFVLLTGEVGTGKTTLCRALLEQLPENTDVALILNPKLTEAELLATICDEMRIPYPLGTKSLKDYFDFMNHHLLRAHAMGRNPVLMIDEAQCLSPEVLELVRLLTNLETSEKKLLQIILVGQPELSHTLALAKMRQTSQRITARYHLSPLTLSESRGYIEHRLKVAGLDTRIFTRGGVAAVHKASRGVPRLINSICDRALLAAYVEGKREIDSKLAKRASGEVLGTYGQVSGKSAWTSLALALALTAVLLLGVFDPYHWGLHDRMNRILALVLPSPVTDVPVADVVESGEPQNAPEMTPETAPEMVSPPPPQPLPEPGQISDVILPDAPPPQPSTIDAAPEFKSPITESETPEIVDISKAESTLIGDLGKVGTLDSALVTLFKQWGQDYLALDGLTPCQKALFAGLMCEQGQTNITGIKAMNRPQVVSFTMPDGELLYGVVSTIEKDLVGESITIDFGDRAIAMQTLAFGLRWPGDYLILWKANDIIQRPLAFGDQGQDVVELRRLLAKAGYPDNAADASGQGSVFFGPSLRDKIRLFQLDHNLDSDGVVTPQTLLHITGVAGETFGKSIIIGDM